MSHDRFVSPPVAVITESAARRMFRDQDPINRMWPATIIGPRGAREKPRIIGVVRDIKYGGLDRAAPATLFAPWEKLAPGGGHLVVRTRGEVKGLPEALRRAVQRADPALPLFTPQSLEQVVAGSMAERRLRLRLAAVFAALALALAAIALWGTVAQSVLDRRRELAVRLALGATAAGAVRLMLRGGIAMIAAGVAAGIGAGAAAAQALQHLLHDVPPLDPLTFVSGAGLAILVSVAACYVPARRAAGVSPAELLREG